MKRLLTVVLSLALLVGAVSPALAATEETDYTIVNPYATVDWSTWKTYKANLHTHTDASDGDNTLTEMVEEYYRQGYDILAITDHGVINPGWRESRQTWGVFNGFRKVQPMTEEDYVRLTTGADRDGRGIIDITGGIEINMAAVSKTHVNAYFTTADAGVWGWENDYKTATRDVAKAGGFTVLNHVGDWVGEDFPERFTDETYIAYFADILLGCDSCLGLEVINNTDRVTKYDKVLWDQILDVCIPQGRNVWAFADDDSEDLSDVGRSFELFVLPENTEENVKTAMQNGTFFASSIFARNDIGSDFEGDRTVGTPIVTDIAVDQQANTITVQYDESIPTDGIEWVCGIDKENIKSKVIATGNTIDLNDYEDELGSYIRFQLKGEGGITYSQAFELEYEGRPEPEVPQIPLTSYLNPCNPLYLVFRTKIVAALQLLWEKVLIKVYEL